MPMLLILLFSACGFTQSIPVNSPTPITRTNINESSGKKLDSGFKDNQAESSNKQDSFECVRATPESILKKSTSLNQTLHFVKTNNIRFRCLDLKRQSLKMATN